jgi:pimeloyl-ACP methyl ester carboxylesterase
MVLRMRDGRHLYVRVLGRGAPCLLVHGFASDGASWLPFISPLLHRYRFIMPDLRGFGRSRAVPLQASCPLTCYAQDLADVARSLALSDLPVVGMSMGALSTVQCFRLGEAARFGPYMHIDQGPVISNSENYAHGLLGPAQPAFFTRMRALVDAFPQLPQVPTPLSYAALPADVMQNMARVFSEFTSAAFTAKPVRDTVRALTGEPRLLRYFLPEAGFATYVQIMRAYLEQNYDLREAFREIRVPLTVLIGGASRMYPAAGQHAIGRFAPHAVLCELPGVGHMLPVEAPLRFVRELAGFLAQARRLSKRTTEA